MLLLGFAFITMLSFLPSALPPQLPSKELLSSESDIDDQDPFDFCDFDLELFNEFLASF